MKPNPQPTQRVKRRVNKEELDAFISSYPRKLGTYVCRTTEPAQIHYYDETLGVWPGFVVAFTVTAYSPDDAEGYFVFGDAPNQQKAPHVSHNTQPAQPSYLTSRTEDVERYLELNPTATLAEIAKAVGLSGPSAVQYQVNKIKRRVTLAPAPAVLTSEPLREALVVADKIIGTYEQTVAEGYAPDSTVVLDVVIQDAYTVAKALRGSAHPIPQAAQTAEATHDLLMDITDALGVNMIRTDDWNKGIAVLQRALEASAHLAAAPGVDTENLAVLITEKLCCKTTFSIPPEDVAQAIMDELDRFLTAPAQPDTLIRKAPVGNLEAEWVWSPESGLAHPSYVEAVSDEPLGTIMRLDENMTIRTRFHLWLPPLPDAETDDERQFIFDTKEEAEAELAKHRALAAAPGKREGA